jgi:hypothetical protein
MMVELEQHLKELAVLVEKSAERSERQLEALPRRNETAHQEVLRLLRRQARLKLVRAQERLALSSGGSRASLDRGEGGDVG